MITTAEYVNSPDNLEAEIIDIQALEKIIAIPDLVSLLHATSECDSWDNVGGPGTIEELQGLLIAQHRPEVLKQVRFVLAILERQLLHGSGVAAQGNLLTRAPLDEHPNTPLTRLYDVRDLLQPRGQYSIAELIRVLNVSKIRQVEQTGALGIPHLEIHVGRFLVAYLHDDHVEPLEAKLRELRMK